MSEALADEIEAINSIYGDSTLVKLRGAGQEDTYILTLPDIGNVDSAASSSSSLRIYFSPAYPDKPPSILGTHSLGAHAKRGAAARNLELFRAAVGDVFEPGQVCLFDAVEKVKELLAE